MFKMARKPIKGFSLFSTDGAGVFLRDRLIRPVGDIYQLIPDGGDGVNVVEVSVKEALLCVGDVGDSLEKQKISNEPSKEIAPEKSEGKKEKNKKKFGFGFGNKKQR